MQIRLYQSASSAATGVMGGKRLAAGPQAMGAQKLGAVKRPNREISPTDVCVVSPARDAGNMAKDGSPTVTYASMFAEAAGEGVMTQRDGSTVQNVASVLARDSTANLAAGKVQYMAWRNERRKQGRRNVNMMLAKLDSTLPAQFQSSPSRNGAGGRAIGNSGRSLHDVLTDTVRCLAKMRQDALHRAHGVDGTEVVKHALRASKSILCVEVESAKGDDACVITDMGAGAKDFFAHSPWGDVKGDSMAHFVKCGDLAAFHSILGASRASGPGQGSAAAQPIHLMHFGAAAGGEELGCGNEPLQTASRLQATADGLPDAFSYDPLLDPLPDTIPSQGGASVNQCSFIPVNLSLHPAGQTHTAGPGARTDKSGWSEASSPPHSNKRALIMASLDLTKASIEPCDVCGGLGGGCRRSALDSMARTSVREVTSLGHERLAMSAQLPSTVP